MDFCSNMGKVPCICEFSNGGRGRNGIVCNDNGILATTLSCYDDDFCTGPTTKEKAVDSSVARLLLCSSKIKYDIKSINYIDILNYFTGNNVDYLIQFS